MRPSVNDIRLVQVFLSQTNTPGPGIYEVSANDAGTLFCTCPGYKGRKTCKHSKFVQARIDGNNGHYPLEISSRATQDDAEKAKRSNENFREFVIKFGKIEVF
jgi:S-adenosylhomocysteine hydrolase